MEEKERRTAEIRVPIISKEQFCKIMEELLVHLFDDTGDWIGYWMYEAYWKPFSWWDEQHIEHTVASHEDLYGFLMDNLIAHRTAAPDMHEE